jgi:hypothetical protein
VWRQRAHKLRQRLLNHVANARGEDCDGEAARHGRAQQLRDAVAQAQVGGAHVFPQVLAGDARRSKEAIHRGVPVPHVGDLLPVGQQGVRLNGEVLCIQRARLRKQLGAAAGLHHAVAGVALFPIVHEGGAGSVPVNYHVEKGRPPRADGVCF